MSMHLKKHFTVSVRKTFKTVKNVSTRCVTSISAALKRKWNVLPVPPHELRLDITLTNGQCFGWKRYPLAIPRKAKSTTRKAAKREATKRKATKREATEEKVSASVPIDGEVYFYGAIGSDVFLLKQTPTDTRYQVLNDVNGLQETKRIESVLHDYFQLETNLRDLYAKWQATGDKKFTQISSALPGMRILRQDPAECLFSFMCSSNNNISRIILMLDRLRERYGDMLWADAELGIKCYSFPSIERLADATEKELRELGLGYRAPWICAAAISLHQMAHDSSPHASGNDFLLSLRKLDQQAVQDTLIQYKGVGRKVADCVALFSLDQCECIPVDTHVWQIACRDLDPTLRATKSLTPSVYKRVGALFRQAFDTHAGWAHSVLFAAELNAFAPRLPKHIVADIQHFRLQEKLAKKEKKEQLSLKKKRSAAKDAGGKRKRKKKKT